MEGKKRKTRASLYEERRALRNVKDTRKNGKTMRKRGRKTPTRLIFLPPYIILIVFFVNELMRRHCSLDCKAQTRN